MQNITIEKGILIPALRNGGGKAKYIQHLRALEVSESIFIPDKSAAQVSAVVHNAKKETGRDFTSRSIDGGCRIWRIA